MKAAPAKRSRKSAAAAPRAQTAFEPLEHSVYVGRQRLGCYERVATARYKAYDARGRLIGNFRKRTDALTAIDGSA
jgi:hypothetical protein